MKDLIPEFFYMPEFLENRFNLDLGEKQSGEKVILLQIYTLLFLNSPRAKYAGQVTSKFNYYGVSSGWGCCPTSMGQR